MVCPKSREGEKGGHIQSEIETRERESEGRRRHCYRETRTGRE